MTTTPNFQSDIYKKNANSKNSFVKGKDTRVFKEMEEDKKKKIKNWVTFYRHNLWIFVEHYLGIKLFPYQRFWITLISQSTNFLGIAARAAAKSWLIGVFSVAKCILYPGTTISLNSSTKAQAGLIISEKIVSLINNYPNVAREISSWVANRNDWEVIFHNGSKIKVIVSSEAGRGARSTVVVLEERRLIPTEVIDSIIRPFLVSRQPPYLKNPKYLHLQEEPQEIIISSAYYKSFEWWDEAKKLIKMMVNGDPDVKAIFLDYLIAVKHGIKTKKLMEKEKQKLDPISFQLEYQNIPYGGASAKAFFRPEFFNRNVKNAWRPYKTDLDSIKKNPYEIKRKPGERRVVACDLAARAGKKNDNTIITCARLIPSKKGWQTEICYIESHNGMNTMYQALRIKQIFFEFTGYSEEDVLVLDIQNIGIGVFDSLTQITKDENRGKEYDAMTVIQHPSISDKVYKELSDRCLSQNATPCIYPISADANLNSNMAVALRNRLKKKLITFLVDDSQEEEFLIRSGDKNIINQEEIDMKAFLLSPNVQTTLMINESIVLETTVLGGGLIKLTEPSGARKDRYSSLSYLNYYVSLLDTELLREENKENDLDVLMSVTNFG